MTLSNVKYAKNIDDSLVQNIMKTHNDYDDKNSPRHSEAGKNQYLQQTLN